MLVLPDLDPVCWPAVLAQLCGGRLSIHALAQELGIPKSTLRGWIGGAQPGHAEGERLLVVWMQVTGKGRELVPREAPPMSASRSDSRASDGPRQVERQEGLDALSHAWFGGALDPARMAVGPCISSSTPQMQLPWPHAPHLSR